MRAIDADVLKQHIDKLPALPGGNFAGNHSALKALINMQPTIEPPANTSEIPNSSDTISRAKAIKDAESWVAVDEYEKHLQKNVVEWLKEFPSAEHGMNLAEVGTDLISRQAALDCFHDWIDKRGDVHTPDEMAEYRAIEALPSAQPERLTDDDFETIRIHLNAYKEKLCNQRRWKEAEEYQRIIDRFMTFASAQPMRKRGKWIDMDDHVMCSCCGATHYGTDKNYCPNCGADMRGDADDEKT